MGNSNSNALDSVPQKLSKTKPCPCSVCGGQSVLTYITIANHLEADRQRAELQIAQLRGASGQADDDALMLDSAAGDAPVVGMQLDNDGFGESKADHDEDQEMVAAAADRAAPVFTATTATGNFSPVNASHSLMQLDLALDLAGTGADALAARLVMNLLDKHVRHHETQSGFEQTLKIIKTILGPLLPREISGAIPGSWDQAMALTRDWLPPMLKIDCCINGCSLFDFENENADSCPVCDEPRYKPGTNKPRQQFRYFSLLERVKRLFSTPLLANLIRHRATREVEPGRIADIEDSKLFKELFLPELGDDIRNLCFALLFDGVRIQEASQNSVWPILLEILSLPSWVRYSHSFLWLMGLVPGGKKKTTKAFFRKHVAACLI